MTGSAPEAADAVSGAEDGRQEHREPVVRVVGITRSFGDVDALRDVSLSIKRGEFLSILGPSGCGKTTLLRIIAGFDRADAGRVEIDGRDVTHDPPNKRPTNMVFQRYALFPHMTVAENVAYGMRLARKSDDEIRARVDEMLSLVRMETFGDRAPSQLSGGQSQRVALVRALAPDPAVLLLDEPMTALDLKLRQAMRVELRDIQARLGSTFVNVTHDQEDALTTSDRIVLMNHGRVVQIGSPEEIYEFPLTKFAAGFIGEANIFEGTHEGQQDGLAIIRAPEGILAAPVYRQGRNSSETAVCVRPERMTLTIDGSEHSKARNSVAGQVHSAVFLGPFVRHQVDLASGKRILVQGDAHSDVAAPVGATVRVEWSPDCGRILAE